MKNNYLIVQKELQKPIFFEDFFEQDKRDIYFSISSEKGLEYLDSGINGFHNYGFKKLTIKLKKKVEFYDIFYQYWLIDPDSPCIFFLHGNAENSSTHPKFFYYFLSKNYNVFTFDHIGHGSSSGYRGVLYDYSEYIETIIQIFQFYHNILKNSQNIKYKNKKIKMKEPTWILAGFSMGGLLAVDFINKMRSKNSKYYKKSDNFSNEYTFKKDKIDNNPLKNLSKEMINNTNKNDNSYENDTSIYTSIKSVILLAPWLSTHKRLINNLVKLYLKLFSPLFDKEGLISVDLQRKIFNMDESQYIKLNKNLTDNETFLKIRFKDKRIYRLNSKFRLATIIHEQDKLIRDKQKIEKEIFAIIPENDYVVDSNISIKYLKSQGAIIHKLPGAYHDFLDYNDYRWTILVEHLNNYLTKFEE